MILSSVDTTFFGFCAPLDCEFLFVAVGFGLGGDFGVGFVDLDGGAIIEESKERVDWERRSLKHKSGLRLRARLAHRRTKFQFPSELESVGTRLE